jgi:hypothetical protein
MLKPSKKSDINNFEITGLVKNKYLSRKFSLKVNVSNDPPYFDSALTTTIEVKKL